MKFLFLAAVALSLTAPGYAVTTPASEAENDPLEEVIVTARKVRENVRDIPLSIQVLSGEQLDEADLSSLFDLQHQVPGLVLNTLGMFGAGFALRGVSDQGGMHMNGVYLGSSHLAIARSFDLERIEVLKGPQGTLYGRNANGGSINFITRVPEDELGGELETAYGSFNTTRLQGHVNVPVGDAAVRVAFIGSEGDGFIRNVVDERRFGEADYWGLRGSLRLEPNERWLIDFTVQRVYDDGASAELWLPNPSYLPDPDDIHLTRVTLKDPYLRIENDFSSLTASYDAGFVSVRSITGFAQNETNDLDDCAGEAWLEGCIRGGDPLTHKQWSQELQLVSAEGGQFNWLAGVNYFSGAAREHAFRWHWLPPAEKEVWSDTHSTYDDTAWAVFGHARLDLGDGWGLSGGLRFSDEDSDISEIGTGTDDNPDLVVAGGNWNHPSARLDLEYTAREGLLYYAGFSTGFRSGGVTTERLPDGQYDSFLPEDLLAFETGLKAQWPDLGLTLDAAAFHYNFDNLQSSSVYNVDGITIVETDNAAEAEVYGIDVAASLQASEQFSFTTAVVWLPKREFVHFINAGGDDLSGNEFPRAPEWNAIATLSYAQPLAQYGLLTGRVEYSYRSGYFYTRENVSPYVQDAYGLLNLLLRFEPAQANWYAFATGRNLSDEDYFHQVFYQAAPGYPDTYELGVGYRF